MKDEMYVRADQILALFDAEIKQAISDTTIAVESTMEAQCDAKIDGIFDEIEKNIAYWEDKLAQYDLGECPEWQDLKESKGRR